MRLAHFLLICFFFLFTEISAQDITTPPVFNYACQIDSNCLLYKRLGVYCQVDSLFYHGGLEKISATYYDSSGKPVKMTEWFASNIHAFFTTEYFYDENDKCVRGKMASIIRGDTNLIVRKQQISDDTASGDYAYEIYYWTPAKWNRDSAEQSLETDYIVTACDWTPCVWYANHAIVKANCKVPGSPTKGTMFIMHDQDSLFMIKMSDEGVGSRLTWDGIGYPDKNTRTRLLYYGGRPMESFTWKDGKLTEHHKYVDSLRDRDVVETKIYNLLDTSALPEVIIVRSDTMTKVIAHGTVPFIDYTPDSCRIAVPIAQPEPEFPTHEYFSAFRYTTKMEDGGTKIDFYNPYSGTALPVYTIWSTSEGVVYRIQDRDRMVKRTVKYKNDER